MHNIDAQYYTVDGKTTTETNVDEYIILRTANYNPRTWDNPNNLEIPIEDRATAARYRIHLFKGDANIEKWVGDGTTGTTTPGKGNFVSLGGDNLAIGVNSNTADRNSVIVDTPAPVYRMKLQVLGNNIKFYIGNLLVLDYTDTVNPILSGGFAYASSGQNQAVLDNFLVTKFTEVDAEVDFGSVTVTAAPNLGTATTIEGTISLKNYTDSVKPIKLVAAAYGAGNRMLGAQVITEPVTGSMDTFLPANDVKIFDYSLTGLPTGTQYIRVFAWNDFTNISSYCGAYTYPN